MPERAEERAAAVFRALGHPTRVWLVRRLAAEVRCVCELMAELGADQPILSQHLQVLKRAGVVWSRREGNRINYGLTDPGYSRMVSLADELP